MENSYLATGTHAGNGAAKNISIGWKPKKVTLFDVTNNVTYMWTNTMANATAVKTVTDGTQSFVAADMVTPYTGSTTTTAGFTIGATLNTNAATFHWTAER
jgi:hypothetical protein